MNDQQLNISCGFNVSKNVYQLKYSKTVRILSGIQVIKKKIEGYFSRRIFNQERRFCKTGGADGIIELRPERWVEFFI